MFEITKSDLAGRIGRIHTNHGVVETPAYVPVVHPVKQDIDCTVLKNMGFEMIITNAYITMRRHGQEAVRRGIHDIVKFEGPIMTDSGGYQVLEYGDLEITPDQMARYETDIMTDIAVPLDKPTGFGLSHRVAAGYVTRTLKASGHAIDAAEDNGQIWTGPVQGGEHMDLVRKSARALLRQGYTHMALGSPVEFMESYRYDILAHMLATARLAIPPGIPLHLFGAGHPLTIPLAVALGYDTFDSASYILYAKQERYITPEGTRHLADLYTFPCSCRICTSHTPSEMMQQDKGNRTRLLALHNLYAIKLEVDATKEAIHEGRLWEHVIRKARAHPRLYDAIPVLAENRKLLQTGTARFKDRAAFFFDRWDQFRPEAEALRHSLKSYTTKKHTLYILPEPKTKPAYISEKYAPPGADIQVCVYNPYLGIIPLELSDMYPAAHHLDARMHPDPRDCPAFGRAWDVFIKNNNFTHIHYDPRDGFISHFVRRTAATLVPYEK